MVDPGSILGREDPLEKEMATHSSILAWKIPWREDPDRLQSVGSQSDKPKQPLFTFTLAIFSKEESLMLWLECEGEFPPIQGKI